ncbi:CsbD family protein [Methylocapsa palsarum]|uniref:Uncharacterized conserved protein YjbJ, UPF0337 family n=1 Tax=Methylocapsa palsarum TaxID=1612308 RepID=A0A1I3XHV4_9HYPH|nr:CsbD family protein [Methylocapsa palsarum]SFK18929.1 Uncharacterized conserved protein YjbJ, UPF0337 family [Methylocapsa palsarum]
MSSTTDKVAGVADKAMGNVKEVLGKAVGSEKLQAEGLAQKAKGDIEKGVGDAKSSIKEGANKVVDAIDKKL